MLKSRKTTIWLLTFIIFLVIISVVPAVGLSNKTKKFPSRKLTTFEKIELAQEKGKISKDREILYKAQAILEPHSLPGTFKGKPSKSGTMVLLEILKLKHKIKDKKIRQKVNYLTKTRKVKRTYSKKISYTKYYKGATYSDSVIVSNDPDFNTYSYTIPVFDNLLETATSDNFQVWYTTTGVDATTSEYAQKMLDILENVYQAEILIMGYREPPGISNRFQVFLKDLVNVYGMAYSVNDLGNETADSFLVVENDFSGFFNSQEDNQKVTAAHEFFHAVQFAYNTFNSDLNGINAWWMEATATWMEDEVYPDINDYLNYLYAWDNGPEGWFAYPEESLTTFDDGHQYGSVVFPKYLQAKSGRDKIKAIWVKLDGNNFGPGLGKSIIRIIGEAYNATSYNLAFNNIYSDFMVQNYIINPASSDATTKYSPTDAFDIAARKSIEWFEDFNGDGDEEEYPYNIYVRDDIVTGPTTTTVVSATNSDAPQYLGANYNIINAPATTRTTEFKFTSAKTTTKWAVKLLLEKQNGSFVINTLVPTGYASGTKIISNFGASSTYKRAIINASVVAPITSLTRYGYNYYGKIDTTTTIYVSSSKAKNGARVRLYGKVAPKPSGTTYVKIQRLYGSSWRTIKTLATTKYGNYSWYWTAPSIDGKYRFRATYPSSSTSKYAGSISSTYKTVIVY